MRLTYVLIARLFLPAMIAVTIWSMPGCSKNSGPGNNNDSDTVLHRNKYDSAVFYVSFLINIYNTSGVYQDTFSDDASMKIYIVNGVVTIPKDSILNFPPIVFPSSGSSGIYTAVWIPDNIGEINITSATGLVTPGDSEAVIVLGHTGCVTPKWRVTSGNVTTTFGGEPVIGWPPGLTFRTRVQSQDAFKLEQPGSYWDVWVYKDY